MRIKEKVQVHEIIQSMLVQKFFPDGRKGLLRIASPSTRCEMPGRGDISDVWFQLDIMHMMSNDCQSLIDHVVRQAQVLLDFNLDIGLCPICVY